MELTFTAVFRKVPEGYIGFVEELPSANTQGTTLEKTKANLQEAAESLIEANRESIGELTQDGEVIRIPLRVATAQVTFDS